MSILVYASSKSHFNQFGSVSTISRQRRTASFFSLISAKSSSSKRWLKTNSRLGKVPDCVMAIRNKSCFVISNISSSVKSSVGFSFLPWLLHWVGAPSFPWGLNYYKLSFMQSNKTLLCICWHSAKKFLLTPSSWSSSSVTLSKSKPPSGMPLLILAALSRLSFLLFSSLRYRSSDKTLG